MSEDEIRAIVASIVMHAAVAANNPATIKHNQSMISKYEIQLIDCLALRDQQVTLADCRSVVEGMFQFDTDCGYLIDAQDTITALAQLPWPHGSGETPPHFEGKAIMQGTAPVVHQGKGTALYASPDDAASTQDAPTEVE